MRHEPGLAASPRIRDTLNMAEEYQKLTSQLPNMCSGCESWLSTFFWFYLPWMLGNN